MRRSQNGHVQVLTLLHVAWRLLPIEDGADYIARFAQDAFGRHRSRIERCAGRRILLMSNSCGGWRPSLHVYMYLAS